MSFPISIIILIIFIIAVVLIIKFVKGVIKIIYLIASLIIIILLITALFLFIDIKDFREKFPTNPSLFLLEKDSNIIAGFYGIFSEESEPNLVSEQELISYQTNFKDNNLGLILGQENYKLFIINSNAFEFDVMDINENISLEKQEVFSLLNSQNAIEDFLDITMGNGAKEQKEEFMENSEIKDNAEFKGILFAILFRDAQDIQGPLFIFNEYKKDNIMIYPETLLFKFIKKMPSFLQDKIIKIKGEE